MWIWYMLYIDYKRFAVNYDDKLFLSPSLGLAMSAHTCNYY